MKALTTFLHLLYGACEALMKEKKRIGKNFPKSELIVKSGGKQ